MGSNGFKSEKEKSWQSVLKKNFTLMPSGISLMTIKRDMKCQFQPQLEPTSTFSTESPIQLLRISLISWLSWRKFQREKGQRGWHPFFWPSGSFFPDYLQFLSNSRKWTLFPGKNFNWSSLFSALSSFRATKSYSTSWCAMNFSCSCWVASNVFAFC